MQFVLTEKENETMETIARKGPLTGYDLHLGGKKERGKRKAIMSSGHWITVKESLEKKQLIHFNPEETQKKFSRYKYTDARGRRRDLYTLTFKGLHYCLFKGFVKVKDAPVIMGQHRIRVPPLPDYRIINTFANFKAVKQVAKTIKMEKLERAVKELLAYFSLEFFSALKKIRYDLYDTDVEYAGSIYMGVLSTFLVEIASDLSKVNIIFETEYLKEFYLEAAGNFLSIYQQGLKALKKVG